MTKIGRNEKCPCGSSLKYKRCCLDREDEIVNLSKEDFGKLYKVMKEQSKIKNCLHPDIQNCSSKIIKAHSIQNSKILKSISDNGKVFMPYPKNYEPFNKHSIWGRKEATTFTGFCGYHDTTVFSPIENNTFNKSEKHCFLYSYRSWALSYHRKREAVKLFQLLFRKKPSLIKKDAFMKTLYSNKTAVRDIEYYKRIFNKCIIKNEWNSFEHLVWELPLTIKFAANGISAITHDLKGKELQSLLNNNIRTKYIIFSIFPEENHTYCIFSWTKEDNSIYQNFIKQMKNLNQINQKKFLNNFIAMECENIVINPVCWDNMMTKQQEDFMDRIHHSELYLEFFSGKPTNMLQTPSYDLFAL